VFGKVIKGMDVVNRIREVRTRSMGPMRDVPADAVVIESVSVIGAK
jgi:cyclophilin family peptidyl-prolyl cis-trans isomerase